MAGGTPRPPAHDQEGDQPRVAKAPVCAMAPPNTLHSQNATAAKPKPAIPTLKMVSATAEAGALSVSRYRCRMWGTPFWSQ